MKLERKHAFVLLAIAAWNVITYLRFIKALVDTEDRPTGYYVAHTVLIIVNLVDRGAARHLGRPRVQGG